MIDNLLEDAAPNIRTQISLTAPLKKAIEVNRRLYGESLSEYLRKAALTRLLTEAEEVKELSVLAANFTRPKPWSGRHPNWKDKKSVKRWQNRIRGEWQR